VTLRRPKNPGTRRHIKRTDAQERAFRVFRLRGLWFSLYGGLTGHRLAAAQALIDAELADLGVETQTARRARERRELYERLAAEEAAERELEAELPF